jgi:hypothetical protein
LPGDDASDTGIISISYYGIWFSSSLRLSSSLCLTTIERANDNAMFFSSLVFGVTLNPWRIILSAAEYFLFFWLWLGFSL